jgi:hypothetical protein
LTNCWPGYVIGRPRISSWSFANATIEPANEIEPISAESTIATRRRPRTCPVAQDSWNSASAISAAAPPPTPLNSATICGIAVIFTLRARDAPKPPPIASRSRSPTSSSTVLDQRDDDRDEHPDAPIWLPRRACAGGEEAQREDERRRS